MLSKVLGKCFDRLMILSKPAEHVVEVAIIDIVLGFEVDFELIDGHVFRCILHDFKDLAHIVLVLLLFAEVSVVMSIIEEYQPKFLIRSINL